MDQCHFCGRCQDPRCLSKEAHVPDCTGLDVGATWGAWCLMCLANFSDCGVGGLGPGSPSQGEGRWRVRG